jgi:hypothetical protein
MLCSEGWGFYDLGTCIHRRNIVVCWSSAPSTQVYGTVSIHHLTKLTYAEESSIVGGIIARKIKSHKIIFNRLLPIAEQRCLERDLANLGQKVPKHVCIFSLSFALGYELTQIQNDCIQWIMETSPKNAPWTPKRVVHELMAIWFGSVHAVSTVSWILCYTLQILTDLDCHLRHSRSMSPSGICWASSEWV